MGNSPSEVQEFGRVWEPRCRAEAVYGSRKRTAEETGLTATGLPEAMPSKKPEEQWKLLCGSMWGLLRALGRVDPRLPAEPNEPPRMTLDDYLKQPEVTVPLRPEAVDGLVWDRDTSNSRFNGSSQLPYLCFDPDDGAFEAPASMIPGTGNRDPQPPSFLDPSQDFWFRSDGSRRSTLDGPPPPSPGLWYIQGSTLRELQQAARVFHPGSVDDMDCGQGGLLPYNRRQDAGLGDCFRAQLTAVAGPVFLTATPDANGDLRPKTGELRLSDPKCPRIILISIAGINLNYSAEDVRRYVSVVNPSPFCQLRQHDTHAEMEMWTNLVDDSRDGRPDVPYRTPWRKAVRTVQRILEDNLTLHVPREGTSTDEEGTGQGRMLTEDVSVEFAPGAVSSEVLGFRLNEQRVQTQMRRVWTMALHAASAMDANTAVLTAIGCGAFRGPYVQVPRLWAQALREVLEGADARRRLFPAVDRVFVCFVRALQGPMTEVFEAVFRGYGSAAAAAGRRPPPTCLILPDHSALSVAEFLARAKGHRVALLNPSDVYAVRKGHIGMFFDGGGHVALEELLGVATTAVLTMHRRLNPDLWSQEFALQRWVRVPLQPGVTDTVVAAIRKSHPGRRVLTFIGYSGEYADPGALERIATVVLASHPPAEWVVNIGATVMGIGALYPLAKRLGYATTGIVSQQAKAYPEQLSPAVNTPVFVEDTTWGGWAQEYETLQPTSEAMVDVSDEIVAIGGGNVGKAEMVFAAEKQKLPVTFYPARRVVTSQGQPPEGEVHQLLVQRYGMARDARTAFRLPQSGGVTNGAAARPPASGRATGMSGATQPPRRLETLVDRF